MSLLNHAEYVSKFDLFHGLPVDDVKELLAECVEVVLQPEDPVMMIDGESRELWLLLHGWVDVEFKLPDQSTRPVVSLGPGSLLGEVGFVSVPDLPDKSVLRFDGPGTFVGGDLAIMTATGNAASGSDPADAFADSFSWGYQILGKLDYNNLARMPAEEVAKRRAEFDKIKQVALDQRKQAGVG